MSLSILLVYVVSNVDLFATKELEVNNQSTIDVITRLCHSQVSKKCTSLKISKGRKPNQLG